MFSDYSKYDFSDFLTDDYFVETMLDPTPESEAFWNKLIDDHKMNVDEFISAYMVLKDLYEKKPEVPQDRIDLLWNRIDNTNQFNIVKAKRFQIIRYMAIACCIVGVIGFSLFTFMKPENDSPQSITEFANENISDNKQDVEQIQIVSGDKAMAVVGEEAKVEYDRNGKLKVNAKYVADSQAKEGSTYKQLRVPYGKRALLNLSDGTTLWVNAGSTVIYPITFDKVKREIFIEGEVYAEVAHEAKRPFIVRTGDIDVQVLGTVFNVTAYKEDKRTNVVLVSGSVKVKSQKGRATVMKPNQLYSYSDQACTLSTVNVENYTSWHNGNYIFQSEPIENILIRLSRYYDVKIDLPSEPSGITCSGKLELKNDLGQLLNGLSEITSMKFVEKDNEYHIRFE